jgi:transposase
MHTEQGLSPRQIATLLGTSVQNIYEHLGKWRAAQDGEGAA